MSGAPASGPIVACDNAIEHYDKQIDGYEHEIGRLTAELNKAKGAKNLMSEMRQQWVDAKNRLQS